jgi:hypothetical protein
MTEENQLENATLPETQEGEIGMPQIACSVCGFNYRTISQTASAMEGSEAARIHREDVLRGLLTCGSCGEKIIFQLQDGYALTFLPGKILTDDLRKDAAPNAKEMFNEAVRCFYGDSGRGVVAFCRSAVEEALAHKNVRDGDLNQKIANTPRNMLGDEERSQATGARLTGRNALHRMASISDSQVMLALQTTVDLLNHIALQEPLPASQSETDSSV